MDICKVIQDDHGRILAVVDELDALDPADPRRARQGLDLLTLLLESHARAEEQLVYPLLQQDSEGRDLMLLAIEEHHVVSVLLHELRVLPVADERFAAKITVLAANLEDHLEAEEADMLPLLMDLIGEPRAQELGRRFRNQLAVLRSPEQRAA